MGGTAGMSPEDLRRLEVLSRRLKEHRDRHALSQEQFAEECDLSRSHIANIERRAYLPGKTSRPKLARALGVAVEDLFTHPQGHGG